MISLALFMGLAQQCAPVVAPATMAAVVRVESGFNPWAIGVVRGRLQRQPASRDEAIATARALDAAGWNYSAGLAQVNRANWSRFGLTHETVFDPCRNLEAGAAILQGCFEQAKRTRAQAQDALRAGLSCYASGDFLTGYRTGYVQRVVAQAGRSGPVVPAIEPVTSPIPVEPVEPVAPANATGGQPSPRPKQATDDRTAHPPDPNGDVTQQNAVVF